MFGTNEFSFANLVGMMILMGYLRLVGSIEVLILVDFYIKYYCNHRGIFKLRAANCLRKDRIAVRNMFK